MHLSSNPILLQTKLHPPAVPLNEVRRTRILQKLPDFSERFRLLIVTAPAGSGKTTLLNQWARREAGRSAWLSLDTRDNDPARFWRYVIEAFRAAQYLDTSRVITLLQMFPNISVHTVIDTLLNEFAFASEPIVLVLDDYHLITEPAIHDGLFYMIDHLPENVRIAIASRSELPFSASKWVARGEVAEVTTLQLHFSEEEANRFYRNVAKLPLSRRQIGKLMETTEGWVAGLQLVSIALRQHSSIESCIGTFSGFHPKLSEYLFQEVFRELDPALRQFLLQTSVLQRMDAVLCDAFTGRSDGSRMLAQVRKLNLFLVPLDELGESYRYHHLFSEFLQNELTRGDRARFLQLHQTAARLFMERGLFDDAVDHALAAEDYAAAEQLLGTHIETALGRGEFSTLLRWFETFPDPLGLNPRLLLLHAFLLVVTKQFERAEPMLDSLEHDEAGWPDEDRGQIRSGLFFVRANLAFTSGRFEEWYGYADRFKEMMPESAVFYNFNYNCSEPLVRMTDFGLKGALFAEVESIALRFTGMLEARGWGDALIAQYVLQSLAEGYYEWNRLDESDALLTRTEAVGRKRRVAGLFVPNRITYARIRLVEGSATDAREAIEEAIDEIKTWGEFGWTDPLHAFLAFIDLIEGMTDRAAERLALLRLSPGGKPTFDKAFEYMTLARLTVRLKRDIDAQRLLESLKRSGARERCLSIVAESALLLAMLELRRGNRTDAFRYVLEVLTIGEANGYVRLFLDEGEKAADLLAQYVRHRETSMGPFAADDPEERVTRYARSLLERFPGRAPSFIAATPLIEPLTRGELRLLELLRRGASNKQMAKELNLTEGTVKVYLSRIYGKLAVSSRTQALLKVQELGLIR